MRLLTGCFALILSALTLGLTGCGKGSKSQASHGSSKPGDPPPDYVVAMVNTTPLSWEEMNRRAMGFLKDEVDTNHLIIPSNRLEEAKSYFRRRAIQAYVFKTVMLDEAIKQNIRLTERDRQEGLKGLANTLKNRNWTTNDFFLKGPMNEAAMRREFDDGLVIEKLLSNTLRTSVRVDNKELVSAIEMIGATNDLKRAKLETVRKQLLDGANFEDVAHTVSECPSAQKGGDLGEFAKGKMPKPFEDAAFAQKVGVVGPIVETDLGFHLIKVTAHAPAQAASASTPAVPETVHASHILIKRIPVDRKKISESILRSKYNAGVQNYFTELKAKSKVECFLYTDMKF